jgi:hypothetical protein
MYINANVVDRQFELTHTYIHLGLFLPVNQTRTEKAPWGIYFYYFVQTPVFHIHSQGEQPSMPQRGKTQSSILSVCIESSCGFGYFSPITSKPWGSFLKGLQEYK